MITQYLPPISITSADIFRLKRLADQAVQGSHPGGAFLSSEVERASLHAPSSTSDYVRLDEWVYFRTDEHRSMRGALLVLPERISGDRQQLSVLSPLGAALIGLRVGSRMPYKSVDGAIRAVTVIRVGVPRIPSLAEYRNKQALGSSDDDPSNFDGPTAA
jgi:regulator of nucleoside diphosphate kinase